MRLPKPALVAGLIALSVAPSAVSRAETLGDGDSAAPAAKCWSVQTQTPYRGFGYDHIVEIANGCDTAIACSVRTDVNPEITDVSIAAHQTATLITFHGSPASEFKANVQCKRVSPTGG